MRANSHIAVYGSSEMIPRHFVLLFCDLFRCGLFIACFSSSSPVYTMLWELYTAFLYNGGWLSTELLWIVSIHITCSCCFS